jgi:hypothetical protein
MLELAMKRMAQIVVALVLVVGCDNLLDYDGITFEEKEPAAGGSASAVCAPASGCADCAACVDACTCAGGDLEQCRTACRTDSSGGTAGAGASGAGGTAAAGNSTGSGGSAAGSGGSGAGGSAAGGGTGGTAGAGGDPGVGGTDGSGGAGGDPGAGGSGGMSGTGGSAGSGGSGGSPVGHYETLTDPGGTGSEAGGLIPVCCVPSEAEQVDIDQGFQLLNQHRLANGRSALAYDVKLQAAIEGHCHHMSVHSFFAHDAPEASLTTPWTRATKCGTSANGENLIQGSTSASSAMNGWIGSPGHNGNMLSTSFRRVGVGRYMNRWGQLFGT